MSETDENAIKDPSMKMEWESDEAKAAEVAEKAAAEARAPVESSPEAEADDKIIGEDGLTDHKRGLIEQWGGQYEDHDTEAKPPDLKDYANEVAEVERMMDEFETNHDIDRLSTIVNVPVQKQKSVNTAENLPVELDEYSARTSAKSDIEPIFRQLRFVKTDAGIPSEQFKVLFAKYVKFAQAIGTSYQDNKIDHALPYDVESGQRDCEIERAVLEKQIQEFEANHDLEALSAITYLPLPKGDILRLSKSELVQRYAESPQDFPENFADHADNYIQRYNAKCDNAEILANLKALKEETNISPEQYRALSETYDYKKISRAIGIVNGLTGMVDHAR